MADVRSCERQTKTVICWQGTSLSLGYRVILWVHLSCLLHFVPIFHPKALFQFANIYHVEILFEATVTLGKWAVCNFSFLQWIADSCRLLQILANTCKYVANWNRSTKTKHKSIFEIFGHLQWNWRHLASVGNREQTVSESCRQFHPMPFLSATQMNCNLRNLQFLSCKENVKLFATFWDCLLLIAYSCKVSAISLKCYFNYWLFQLLIYIWFSTIFFNWQHIGKRLQGSVIVYNCSQWTARNKSCRQPIFPVWP